WGNPQPGTRNVLFRSDDERHNFTLDQRQIKPARTVGVATRSLAAARFDRMRNVFTPLRLGVKLAGIAEHAELPVRRRRELKTRPIWHRSGVSGKMILRGVVASRFRVEVPVLDVHAHGQSHTPRRYALRRVRAV